MEAAADRPKQGDEAEEEGQIPPLEKEEALDVLDWLTEQRPNLWHGRKPALIKALEENGVGRPNTYAAIMSKLDEREYLKIKRSLVPTALVASWLVWFNEPSRS